MEGGTVLINGDSMLTGIDEGRLQIRNSVKLRPFSGASTEDMRSYLKPLLNKDPSVVILHVGTNDSTENGIDSDTIVSRILSLKAEIEKIVDGCKVILSLPIRRRDSDRGMREDHSNEVGFHKQQQHNERPSWSERTSPKSVW